MIRISPGRLRPVLVATLAWCSLIPALDARLGVSRARCDTLYGPAARENPDGSVLYYADGFAYVVFFEAGICDELFILKPDPAATGDDKLELSTDDVARLLDENRPGSELSWNPVEMQSGNGMGWRTDDGDYEAYLLPGGEQMNVSTTIAATARRMDLPRTASGPVTGTSAAAAATTVEGIGEGVPTIFSEQEMHFYHLAFSARKIDDHNTVIKALTALYDLIRAGAENDAATANGRFGYFFSWLGDAYEQSGKARMAVRCYERFLEQFPLATSNMQTTVAVANNLTWMLATHIDESIRDPEIALEYALEIAKRDDLPDPCYNTIAVAYAAVGRFDEALKTLDEVAARTRDPNLLRVVGQHRRLFQQNTAYIEDPER